MDRASVTVIVPTYNRAKYVGQSIESLLNQTLPPTQLIVVDDGSKDETRDVVLRFGTRVEYLSKSNGGKSTALNLGLRYAIGNLIWIFDDDDIAEPDGLAKFVGALRANPQCGFAYGEYDLFTTNGKGSMYTTRFAFPNVKSEGLYLAYMEQAFILQQGLLVKKSCYDNVGPFDETLIRSQDVDMMLRLARHYSGVKVEGITVHVRVHGGVRGSAAVPVSATRVMDAWAKSERKIVGRLYGTLDLREFLPAPLRDGQFTSQQRFTALIQRSCILARKGLWDEAAQDFRSARELAQNIDKSQLSKVETDILRRMFNPLSFAPYVFDGSAEFRAALHAMRPTRLRRDMRAAMLWSLPFSIGVALLHRRYALWRFLRVYLLLATPSSVLRSLLSPSFLAAGLQLIRNRRRTPFRLDRNPPGTFRNSAA